MSDAEFREPAILFLPFAVARDIAHQGCVPEGLWTGAVTWCQCMSQLVWFFHLPVAFFCRRPWQSLEQSVPWNRSLWIIG